MWVGAMQAAAAVATAKIEAVPGTGAAAKKRGTRQGGDMTKLAGTAKEG
jgi:hypothetical protein